MLDREQCITFSYDEYRMIYHSGKLFDATNSSNALQIIPEKSKEWSNASNYGDLEDYLDPLDCLN